MSVSDIKNRQDKDGGIENHQNTSVAGNMKKYLLHRSHCACLHGLTVHSCYDWIIERHRQSETRLANWWYARLPENAGCLLRLLFL